jgi:hypothetical protein
MNNDLGKTRKEVEVKTCVQLVMSLFPTQEKRSPMAEGKQDNESGRSEGANLEERRKARVLCDSSTTDGKSATENVGRFEVDIWDHGG